MYLIIIQSILNTHCEIHETDESEWLPRLYSFAMHVAAKR